MIENTSSLMIWLFWSLALHLEHGLSFCNPISAGSAEFLTKCVRTQDIP